MKLKYLLVIWLLFPGGILPQEIIPKLNLVSGKQDSILISDLFYAKNYKVQILNSSKIELNYDGASRFLFLTPPKDFQGYSVCSIVNEKDTLCFPVFVKKKIKKRFAFETKEKFKKVTLFGEFNNWDRKTIPMNWSPEDSAYTAEVLLDPGVYQYKFWADGKEFVDPSNPDSVPNGLGSYNSVVKIKQIKKPFTFLHPYKFTEVNGTSVFSYYYEREGVYPPLNKGNLIALINNKKINPRLVEIKKNIVTLSIPKQQLKGRGVIRIGITQNGVSTNFLQTHYYNAKPVNNNAPFSFYDATIYSLMIDRFCDGDSSNDKPILNDSLSFKANYQGGDFKGIIKVINSGYFDSLGVSALWISPVNDNPNKAYREYPPPHRLFTGYHGYWPISSYKVEEHFGSFTDLKNVVKSAHKHRIKILLDFVSHHVHKNHPYFKLHRNWFGNVRLPDGRLNIRLWDEHRLTTWFDLYLPSFDFIHSKEARDTMTSNALWWLKRTGADGFRHDAVKHVPNVFWRELTRKLKSNFKKRIYQIGETFGNYALVKSYVNNGQLDAQFNFNLYNVALTAFIDSSKSFADLKNELRKSEFIYGTPNLMGNIMDSHDKNRYMAYADGDVKVWQWDATELGWKNPPKVDHPSSYKKAELYYAYLFTIPGIPVIYYGSEFGMTGASDPDNRRMMRFGDKLTPLEKQMLQRVREIALLRKHHTALRYGDLYFLKANANVFAYIRSDFNESLIIVLNKSKTPRRVSLNLPELFEAQYVRDLLTGSSTPLERNNLTIVVPAIDFKILKILRD